MNLRKYERYKIKVEYRRELKRTATKGENRRRKHENAENKQRKTGKCRKQQTKTGENREYPEKRENKKPT